MIPFFPSGDCRAFLSMTAAAAALLLVDSFFFCSGVECHGFVFCGLCRFSRLVVSVGRSLRVDPCWLFGVRMECGDVRRFLSVSISSLVSYDDGGGDGCGVFPRRRLLTCGGEGVSHLCCGSGASSLSSVLGGNDDSLRRRVYLCGGFKGSPMQDS